MLTWFPIVANELLLVAHQRKWENCFQNEFKIESYLGYICIKIIYLTNSLISNTDVSMLCYVVHKIHQYFVDFTCN